MEQKANLTDIQETEQAAAARTDAQQGVLSPELERCVEQLISKQLAALRSEAQARAAQAKAEGRAEGERLAGMSDAERRQYEDERSREREAQLDRREEELKRRELRAKAADMFVARGLPAELGSIVDCTSEESCEEGVAALEKLFREAVQRAVDERLGQSRPLPRSGGGSQAGIVRRMRAAAGLNEG